MNLPISANLRIGDFQNRFQEYFPYLKLEFFNQREGWLEDATEGFNYHPSITFSKVATKEFTADTFEIHPWDRTWKLEEELYHKYGLFAQLYRRRQDDWIQTAGTEDLTLYEQNEVGKISREFYVHGGNITYEREKMF
jgi:hypothetical protein